MWLARLASALPDAALGVAFLVTWLEPEALGETAVTRGVVTMLLEFIIVHSSAFMGVVALGDGPRARKVLLLLGLGAFYSLFVLGFAAGTGEWWVMAAFWGLTLNRLTGVIFHTAPTGEERVAAQAGWALSTMLYLGWCFATVLLPVPRLGVRGRLPGDTSGLWVSEPYRALAFGAGYFLSQAIFELMSPRWSTRQVREQHASQSS